MVDYAASDSLFILGTLDVKENPPIEFYRHESTNGFSVKVQTNYLLRMCTKDSIYNKS